MNYRIDDMEYTYDGLKMDSGGQVYAIFKCSIGTLMYDYPGLKSFIESDRPAADKLVGVDKALAALKSQTGVMGINNA